MGKRGVRLTAAAIAVMAASVIGALALTGSSAGTPTQPKNVVPAAATSGAGSPAPATASQSGTSSATDQPAAAATAPTTTTTAAPTTTTTTTTTQPTPQIGAPASGRCPTTVCYGP